MSPITSLAYLVSQYPAVTHTFILREVLQLRELGFDIRTVSIDSAGVSQNGLTRPELEEAGKTFYVKARGVKILLDCAVCLLQRPFRVAAGLLLALRLAGLDLNAALYHLLYFGEAIVVGEWMRRNRLDHVHVHFANSAALIALLVRKMHGVQYSITVHGPVEFYDVVRTRLREKVEGAAFICCISRFCRSQLMMPAALEHWGKFELSPLGVDPERYRPRPALHRSEFKIVCTGSLQTRKGQTILLAATARLLQRGRPVQVSFVGDGPDRRALEAEAVRLNLTRHVTFHGSMNQERVLEMLQDADAFVLPSFAEGVPISLMEAMSMEIPAISTNIAGIAELIESGVDGILVPASDAGLLAEALEKLIDDPELCLRLGQAGRRKVMEQYNLRTNVERLAAIFERRLQLQRRVAKSAAASAV